MQKTQKIEYITTNPNYLGTTQDMNKNIVHGFKVQDEIHLIHNLDDILPFSREISEIRENMDNYLFSPWAYFASLV